MPILLPQLFALALLGGGMAWGYRRWVGPRAAALTVQGQGLLALLVLTFLGGLFGGFFWWVDEPRSFAWDLPPLASRMLAAAGWSFAVGTWLALERPTARRVRLMLLLLATYLVPLVAAILVFHLDDFDFGATLTYGFFVIAGGMAAAALRFLARQPVILADEPQELAPASPKVPQWLGVVALVAGLWGLALFVTNNGPSSLVWLWPDGPAFPMALTSRLIGVMLLTLAVGAWWGRSRDDTARLMLAVTTTYGLGLVLANGWSLLAGQAAKPLYLALFGFIFLVSAALLARGSPTRQRLGQAGRA